MKFERTQRIGEEIKKTITKMLIEGHIKNSVLLNTHSLISVVSVDVVRDLKYAYVYISVLGQDNSIKNGVEMISKINKIAQAEHREEEIAETEDEVL